MIVSVCSCSASMYYCARACVSMCVIVSVVLVSLLRFVVVRFALCMCYCVRYDLSPIPLCPFLVSDHVLLFLCYCLCVRCSCFYFVLCVFVCVRILFRLFGVVR